jgi:hypothetical protein
MPLPQSLVLRLVLAGSLGVVADPTADLRVLRVTPADDASPSSSVTVTFDRPVAGSLDRSVDPRSSVRWFIDGRPHAAGRWVLSRGPHRIRAQDAMGSAMEVRITVE